MVDTKKTEVPKDQQIAKQRKLLRKSTFIIFVGVFLLGSLTVLVVKQSPPMKGAIDVAPAITGNLLSGLSAYKKSDSEYASLLDKITAGDRLGLTVSVLRPTYMGLLLSINQQKPSFVFYGRLPPGEKRLIERQGERYLYTVLEKDRSLKFCVVYADDKEALQKI
ncbi:MAG: hypothetical protein OEM38_06000, partial [Gammaproteobacteria bacterium]|nr:hypothetical protein [Gammaproteobacteria bacterium]